MVAEKPGKLYIQAAKSELSMQISRKIIDEMKNGDHPKDKPNCNIFRKSRAAGRSPVD